MSKQNDKDKSQDLPEVQEEQNLEAAEMVSSAEAENESVSLEEYKDLKEKLQASETQAAEYLDGWQRTQAEFINYKKRQERDQQARYESMKADIVFRLLPVLDDLELALHNRPESEDEAVQKWIDGVELIYRKFMTILQNEGVERIEAEGAMFDPNFHEAMSQEESEAHESGQVIAVMRQGYRVGDRVIRPALVRVAA